jgi:hypothetical protein
MDVDIINFQEVYTYRELKLFVDNLPSYKYVAYKRGPVGPKGALVTFSKLPIEVVAFASFNAVSKAADRSRLPRLVRVKSGQKGILVSRVRDMPLNIANAHPFANYDWDWGEGNRFASLQSAQLKLIIDTVQAYETGDGVFVLGGDLNVAKESKLGEYFLGHIGLRDIFADDTAPTFHAAFLAGGMSAPCIDYLLVSGGSGVQIEQKSRLFESKSSVHGVGDLYLTDHIGLKARLSLSW